MLILDVESTLSYSGLNYLEFTDKYSSSEDSGGGGGSNHFLILWA